MHSGIVSAIRLTAVCCIDWSDIHSADINTVRLAVAVRRCKRSGASYSVCHACTMHPAVLSSVTNNENMSYITSGQFCWHLKMVSNTTASCDRLSKPGYCCCCTHCTTCITCACLIQAVHWMSWNALSLLLICCSVPIYKSGTHPTTRFTTKTEQWHARSRTKSSTSIIVNTLQVFQADARYLLVMSYPSSECHHSLTL